VQRFGLLGQVRKRGVIYPLLNIKDDLSSSPIKEDTPVNKAPMLGLLGQNVGPRNRTANSEHSPELTLVLDDLQSGLYLQSKKTKTH